MFIFAFTTRLQDCLLNPSDNPGILYGIQNSTTPVGGFSPSGYHFET